MRSTWLRDRPGEMKAQRIGSWIMSLPDRFRPVPGSAGRQFTDGTTVVFASEMRMTGPDDKSPSPMELHQVARARVGGQHELSDVQFGSARIERTTEGLRMTASREADGSVLTLVVDMLSDASVEEALAIWRSAHT